MTAPYSYGSNTWASQYYATLDKPCGYYDLSVFTSLENVPPESDLFALTADQWAARMDGMSVLSKAVVDGVWGDYVTPIPPVPLKTQANDALTWIASQASMASAMGETFTADMKSYVKAVQAIANGTDTTSTALPYRPTDIMS
ncbi:MULTISPECIES: hypothetical protein [Asaia]|uniref:hypothetical protein n=1 Tax=Asaia TaxID=91914 RepID=UPI002FC3D89F